MGPENWTGSEPHSLWASVGTWDFILRGIGTTEGFQAEDNKVHLSIALCLQGTWVFLRMGCGGPWAIVLVPALTCSQLSRHSGVGRLRHPLADGGGHRSSRLLGGLDLEALEPPDSSLLPSHPHPCLAGQRN